MKIKHNKDNNINIVGDEPKEFEDEVNEMFGLKSII